MKIKLFTPALLIMLLAPSYNNYATEPYGKTIEKKVSNLISSRLNQIAWVKYFDESAVVQVSFRLDENSKVKVEKINCENCLLANVFVKKFEDLNIADLGLETGKRYLLCVRFVTPEQR